MKRKIISVLLTLVLVLSFSLVMAVPAMAIGENPTAPDLGEAGRFVVLASQAVTTTGTTAISDGDIGIIDQARSFITGFTPTGPAGDFTELTNGTSFASDDANPAPFPYPLKYATPVVGAEWATTGAMITQVRTDLGVAYTFLAADPNPDAPTQVCPADLSGLVLTKGVYKTAADVLITADTLTLDAEGDPNSVWIFSIDGTLTVGAPGGNIILANDAQAKNVYWRTAGITYIEEGITFYGNVFAWEQVNVLDGADITGRLFSVNEQVTLIGDTVTRPTGETAPVPDPVWLYRADGTLVNSYTTIQAAIDAAEEGDTITVAAGTYTEDLTIPAALTGLELAGAGAGTTTIKGVSVALGAVVVTILAPDVKLHGFTIETSDSAVGADDTINGVWVAAVNAEIYSNTFKSACAGTGWVTLLTTHSGVGIEAVYGASTADVGGANIHDNAFTSDTVEAWSEGIYVNYNANLPDVTTIVTIQDNTFSGNLFRAITTERSYTTIDENTIASAYTAGGTLPARAWSGIEVRSRAANKNATQDYVVVTNNTITSFERGISLGDAAVDGLIAPITVESNTIATCVIGVNVDNDAGVPTVNYNDISGSTTYGVENTDTGTTLDAEGNWWGDVAGPTHTKNPYNGLTNGVAVSDDVDYTPWMIQSELAEGWNIWSPPIAADASTNTIAEALNFWGSDSSLVTAAYYFNSTTQTWATPSTLSPLQAVYLNLSSSATIDILISDSNNAPPARTMHQGWNLVGPAELYNMRVDNAVSSAEYGTGAASLVGYNHVISPSIHQANWTFLRTDTYSNEDFVPTCGYWVYMVNQGTLGGFTYTPITPLP